MKPERKTKRSRRGLVIYGIILVGLGVYLQLWSMGIMPEIDSTWPLFIILIGLALIIGNFFKKTDRTDSTGTS